MPSLHLYIDDTGSRHPDKKSDASRKGRDWFGLGGFLIGQEHEEAAKRAHAQFQKEWNIRHPFHFTDMLAERQGFAWLGRLSAADRHKFWGQYRHLLASLPVVGMACVIDRPGYVARGYLEKHGANKWLLCRSAFDILVERATKFAIHKQRRLKIVFEGDVGINKTIVGYFDNLKTQGLAFDAGSSGKYRPLAQDAFAKTLTTIEYKGKTNPLLQFADTYIYAMARWRYDKRFDIYRQLRDAKRISNFCLENEQIAEMGVKYYCFD